MPHIHEKIDWTVEVYVTEGDRVLLRKHDKYKLWLSVGGHIELDEEPPEAAVREVREEVGLLVELLGDVPDLTEGDGYRQLPAPPFMYSHKISETHTHVTLIYFAKATGGVVTEGHDERSDEIRWFTEEELEDPVFGILPTIRHFAKAALLAARR